MKTIKLASTIVFAAILAAAFFGCSEDSTGPTTSSAGKIVVLLTDYGESGTGMARLMGYVLTAAPSAEVIEGTSRLHQFDVLSSAFLIKNIYSAYPEGSAFVCIVEPGGAAPGQNRALVLQYDDRYFTAPDNGLLTYMLTDTVRLTGVSLVETLGIGYPSPNLLSTEELFGTIGGLFTRGYTLLDFGAPLDTAVVLPVFEPYIESGVLFTQAAIIDDFGNVTTNAGADEWNALAIVQNDTITVIHTGGSFQAVAGEYYDSVPEGEEVAFINSLNLIEIAVNKDSLAVIYGITSGDTLRILNP